MEEKKGKTIRKYQKDRSGGLSSFRHLSPFSSFVTFLQVFQLFLSISYCTFLFKASAQPFLIDLFSCLIFDLNIARNERQFSFLKDTLKV